MKLAIAPNCNAAPIFQELIGQRSINEWAVVTEASRRRRDLGGGFSDSPGTRPDALFVNDHRANPQGLSLATHDPGTR